MERRFVWRFVFLGILFVMTIPGIFFFLQRNAVLSLGMLEKGGGGGGSLFFGGLDPSFLSETLFLVLVLLYLYVVIQYPWQHYLHYQTQWRRRRMHLEEMRHFTPSSSQSYQENESIDHNHPNQEEEEEDLRHPTLLRPRKKRKKVKETTNTTSSSNWKFTTTWSFPWVPSLLKASITLHASSPLSILSLRGWTSWYWGWSWLTPMLATVGVLYLQRDGVLRTSTWQSFIHVWNPWYVLFLLLLRPCFHLMQRTSMSEESPSKVRKEPRSSTWVAFHTNPTTTTTTKKKKKTMKKKNPLPISFRKGRKNGADGYPAKMTSLLSSVNPPRNTGSQPGALRRPPQHPSTSFFTRPIPSSNEPSPVHASLSNNSPPPSPTPVDSTPETPLPFSSSHEDPPRSDLVPPQGASSSLSPLMHTLHQFQVQLHHQTQLTQRVSNRLDQWIHTHVLPLPPKHPSSSSSSSSTSSSSTWSFFSKPKVMVPPPLPSLQVTPSTVPFSSPPPPPPPSEFIQPSPPPPPPPPPPLPPPRLPRFPWWLYFSLWCLRGCVTLGLVLPLTFPLLCVQFFLKCIQSVVQWNTPSPSPPHRSK